MARYNDRTSNPETDHLRLSTEAAHAHKTKPKTNGPGRSLRVPTKRPSKPETDPLRLRTDTAHARYKINVAQSQIRETSRIRIPDSEDGGVTHALCNANVVWRRARFQVHLWSQQWQKQNRHIKLF